MCDGLEKHCTCADTWTLFLALSIIHQWTYVLHNYENIQQKNMQEKKPALFPLSSFVHPHSSPWAGQNKDILCQDSTALAIPVVTSHVVYQVNHPFGQHLHQLVEKPREGKKYFFWCFSVQKPSLVTAGFETILCSIVCYYNKLYLAGGTGATDQRARARTLKSWGCSVKPATGSIPGGCSPRGGSKV